MYSVLWLLRSILVSLFVFKIIPYLIICSRKLGGERDVMKDSGSIPRTKGYDFDLNLPLFQGWR